MTLADIEGGIYDHITAGVSPGSEVVRRIRRYLNMTHREILGMKGLTRLRRQLMTFASTASDPLVSLPQAAVRVYTIADRANNRILRDVSLQDIRAYDPGQTFTGSIPDRYCIISMASPVNKDPSAAAQIYVKSDAAGDGAGMTCYIEQAITGGYYRRAQVAMNGVTEVAIGPATCILIQKFYLSAAAAGNVTLLQGSGGSELARISVGRTHARYTRLHLSGTPASALTYYADVDIHVEDMLNPYDEPLLPEDFHWLLECGALKREWEKKEKAVMWKIEQDRWLRGIADLKAWVRQQGGLGEDHPARFSQLGPFYSE